VITPQDGSSLYYSLLWTDSKAKDAFLQRLTLINALAGCLDEVQEPTVAEKKIHWWHEELERLAKSTPRHPACVKNKHSLGGNQLAIRHCLSILSSAASIRYTQSESDEQATQLLQTSFKARLALLCDALIHPGSNDKNRDTLKNTDFQNESLALGFAWHDNLYRLPFLLHRDYAVFSDETYARHATTPTDFSREGSQPLLQESIEQALSFFDLALGSKNENSLFNEPALLPLWRLAKLRQEQLKLWQRQGTQLVSERATLTPIKKLYIAWRHRRR